MGMKIVTIGVYGFTEAKFFRALKEAGVEVFCDIRWRRAVRGAAYAFANHRRLAARLEEMGIGYVHRRHLAPNPEIRQRQAAADKRNKIPRRQRKTLGPEFITAYREEVLADFDPQEFLDSFDQDANVVALFCVEGEPAACHRSLLAEALATVPGVEIEHLKPD